MFITESDLAKSLQQELINELKRGDNAIIEHVISAAMAEIKPYLSDNYDTDAVFAATGTDRHGLLVIFATDIALYNLLSLAAPDINLDDRRARYKRAIDWLKQVRDRQITPDLPLSDTPKAAGFIVYGSEPRKTTRF